MQAPGVEAISRAHAGQAAGIEAGASLEVVLGRIGAQLASQEKHRRALAGGISYYPGLTFPAFAGSALPVTPGSAWGPRPGYTWAVQAVRAAGLGATDQLTIYRGRGVADAQPNNALNTLTPAAAGSVAWWNPGSSGLLLSGSDQASLVFGGTVAATLVTVNLDVIQITDALLPFYLL